MNQRIKTQKVNLNYENVKKFYDDRCKNKNLKHKYNYVLLQDEHPEIAVQRDQQEKLKISAMLDLYPGMRALDIGCGIGRWGEFLLDKGLYYVGIDGSSSMIELAEQNLQQYKNKKLLTGVFQEISQTLKSASETQLFDIIFVNGVFIYLNDSDYYNALSDMKKLCNEHCQIYIKESMAKEDRLTLKQIYSEELKQDYSAIYRSVKEYQDSTTKAFSDTFELVSEGQLFDDNLVNRKETFDYYMIWKR